MTQLLSHSPLLHTPLIFSANDPCLVSIFFCSAVGTVACWDLSRLHWAQGEPPISQGVVGSDCASFYISWASKERRERQRGDRENARCLRSNTHPVRHSPFQALRKDICMSCRQLRLTGHVPVSSSLILLHYTVSHTFPNLFYCCTVLTRTFITFSLPLCTK